MAIVPTKLSYKSCNPAFTICEFWDDRLGRKIDVKIIDIHNSGPSCWTCQSAVVLRECIIRERESRDGV